MAQTARKIQKTAECKFIWPTSLSKPYKKTQLKASPGSFSQLQVKVGIFISVRLIPTPCETSNGTRRGVSFESDSHLPGLASSNHCYYWFSVHCLLLLWPSQVFILQKWVQIVCVFFLLHPLLHHSSSPILFIWWSMGTVNDVLFNCIFSPFHLIRRLDFILYWTWISVMQLQ